MALRLGAGTTWGVRECLVRGSGVGLVVEQRSEGKLESSKVEGCGVGMRVGRGAVVQLEGSRVGGNRRQGLVLEGEGPGVWWGERAEQEVRVRGVGLVNSKLEQNKLGDLVVTEEEASPLDRKQVIRRFSTPRAGGAMLAFSLATTASPVTPVGKTIVV